LEKKKAWGLRRRHSREEEGERGRRRRSREEEEEEKGRWERESTDAF
jgi:hypothetical protein